MDELDPIYKMNADEFSTVQKTKLSDVFSALESETIDKDNIKNTLTEILEAQQKYGKINYNRKHSQYKTLETILEEIQNGLGVDPRKNPQEFVETFKSKETQLSTTEEQYRQMEERLRRIEAERKVELEQRESERQKAIALQRENEHNSIRNKLKETLSSQFKPKAIDLIAKDYLVDDRIKIIDGEIMGVDGDSAITFDKVVESILENYSELIVNNQNSGLETFPNKSGSKVKTEQKHFDNDAINKMSPEELRKYLPQIKKQLGLR